MSGLFENNVSEARGMVAPDAEIDQLAIVMACSSRGSGLSPFYLSADSAAAALGLGDGVDSLCQIIEQRQANGNSSKRPAAMITVPVTTEGSYGAIDTTGVQGTAVPTVDATVLPLVTCSVYIRVIDPITVGTAGGSFVWSMDDGVNESRVTALGTATGYTIADANARIVFGVAAATLEAGSIIRVRTFAPVPGVDDVDAAFIELGRSSAQFGILVCDFPADATMLTHFTTGLNRLRDMGKRVTLLGRPRNPNFETDETIATWGAAVSAMFRSVNDSRIQLSTVYGLLTDARTTRQYLRSDLGQWAADVVRVNRGVIPNVPADQPEANFSLVDASGTTIGHDEGPRGTFTGLSNETLGNRFRCVQRLPDAKRVEDVFTTVPWMLFAADERIQTLPVRRIANAMERVAISAGNSNLGKSNLRYFKATATAPAQLTYESMVAIHSVIFQELKKNFDGEIENARDASIEGGLVQVKPNVRVTGGNLLGVDVVLAPSVFGVLLKLNIELAVQQ